MDPLHSTNSLREPLLGSTQEEMAMDDQETRKEERSKLVEVADEEQGSKQQPSEERLLATGDHDDDDGDNDEMDERDSGNQETFPDEDIDEDADELASWRSLSFWKFLNHCALPDNEPRICGLPLAEGPFAVKLFKFVIITFLGIALAHWFVRKMVRPTVDQCRRCTLLDGHFGF